MPEPMFSTALTLAELDALMKRWGVRLQAVDPQKAPPGAEVPRDAMFGFWVVPVDGSHQGVRGYGNFVGPLVVQLLERYCLAHRGGEK